MRDEAPALYRDMQAKALAGKGGRANAVKVNCLQCCGWKRDEVTDCQVKDCPMWHFRPYQPRGGQKTGGLETA